MFQQRDEPTNVVRALQSQKTLLAYEVDSLRREKEKLETTINSDKTQLQNTLAQELVKLKWQRSDLFTISEQEQIARLVGLFLKNIFQ